MYTRSLHGFLSFKKNDESETRPTIRLINVKKIITVRDPTYAVAKRNFSLLGLFES